ncbi:hypothetical protein FHETE_3962 [Fusarium heterosporum]|uniref:Uncharacterized protein n=1 Tax=Fusarium heterosporum TaxID=42747 RepID=A0A8H5WVN2_FUSHE|nr:hypothetical protein FHETE_3962 [Fusarium heterosporum]
MYDLARAIDLTPFPTISDSLDLREQRPPNTHVSTEDGLTKGEKCALADLVSRFNEMSRPSRRLGWKSSRAFYAEVFNNWSSLQQDNPDPTIDDKIFEDTIVACGTLLSAQPRYDGILPFWRRKNSPVYLKLDFRPGHLALGLDCMDAKGEYLDPKWVRYCDSFDAGRALDRGIRNYDSRERKRVDKYNKGCLIATARRRIVQWVTKGSGCAPEVEAGDRFPEVEPLWLIQDQKMERRILYEEFQRRCEAMRDHSLMA